MPKALGHDAECPQRSTSNGPYPNEKRIHPCHLTQRVKTLTEDLSPCLVSRPSVYSAPLSHSNISFHSPQAPSHFINKSPQLLFPLPTILSLDFKLCQFKMIKYMFKWKLLENVPDPSRPFSDLSFSIFLSILSVLSYSSFTCCINADTQGSVLGPLLSFYHLPEGLYSFSQIELSPLCK